MSDRGDGEKMQTIKKRGLERAERVEKLIQKKEHSEALLREKIEDARKYSMIHDLSRDEVEMLIETESKEFRTLMAYYKCALMEIETKFKVLNEEFSIDYERNPITSIKTRLKSAASITEKMSRRKIPFSIENLEKNLFDIAGIRVVCSFRDDIYELADCLLAQDDVFLIERKDYIENPKDNGYRSLHLIIETPIFLRNEKRMMKVEVQLRTIAMDFWASLEHQMKYKKNVNSARLTDELADCALEATILDEKMMYIKNEIEQLKLEQRTDEWK